MQTFNRALVQLYEKGVVSFETGAAYATNPDEFRMNAQGMERGSAAFVAEHDALPAVGSVDMRTLLNIALRYGASDIHLVVGSPPIFRIHGKLRRLEVDSLSAGRRAPPALLAALALAARELRARPRARLRAHRHRQAPLPRQRHFQRGTVAVALRLIPNSIPDAATLGLPPIVRELATKPHGPRARHRAHGRGQEHHARDDDRPGQLVAQLPHHHHRRPDRVRALQPHGDRRAARGGPRHPSFAAALKFILRQDPDVILIGELRDIETISAALTAAETGHLVLATLHTNDAPQTVDRIVDVFPPHQQSQARVQLSAALQAVVSQRLLTRADGKGRVACLRGDGRDRGGARHHPRGQDAPAPQHHGDGPATA
jgi:Tfp pilus assembly pilus retraction ATPase PilT